MNQLLKGSFRKSSSLIRKFSIGSALNTTQRCKLLIIGGGAGGCSVSAKFANKLNKHELVIVEPADTHYYQAMFTMVGGGIKKLEESAKPMGEVLPNNSTWIKDSVAEFDPKNNTVTTKSGKIINYEFLVIAMGLQVNFDRIPGLMEGLSLESSGVCSNYSPKYVNRTFESIKNFQSGNAIFTFPNTPVKCPGAPQKICYITEHYLRKNGKRDKAKIIYNTSLPVLFGVKKYADSLWNICKERNITVNLRTNLKEIRPHEKIAIFENLDKPEDIITSEYSMLHVAPPMSSPDVLKLNTELTNEAGFVAVNKDTLQSTKFENVFAVGDCSASPNSKTAASVAVQSKVVYENLKAVMAGKKPEAVYNGYASCPLVTGYGSCILAEFDYDLKPTETFPMDQGKESYLMYFMKKDMMPPLYFNMMLNGNWNGPNFMRKIFHLSFK